MNATEAREKTLKAIDDSVPEHYKNAMKLIKRQIDKGHFSAYYYENFNSYAYEQLKKLLKKEGYKVSIYEADGMQISWK